LEAWMFSDADLFAGFAASCLLLSTRASTLLLKALRP
jgi:hypothetical protein